MDKTYSEIKGHAPFDWNKWLDDAIEKTPDQDELHAAAIRAREWTTCACGNQCAVIPRRASGEPIDEMLAGLGAAFYTKIHIAEGWPEDRKESLQYAKYILTDIEVRSAIVIKETLAKLNTK